MIGQKGEWVVWQDNKAGWRGVWQGNKAERRGGHGRSIRQKGGRA